VIAARQGLSEAISRWHQLALDWMLVGIVIDAVCQPSD
jgi:hypothetical protein